MSQTETDAHSLIPDDVNGSEISDMEELFAYFRQQISFATTHIKKRNSSQDSLVTEVVNVQAKKRLGCWRKYWKSFVFPFLAKWRLGVGRDVVDFFSAHNLFITHRLSSMWWCCLLSKQSRQPF
jgi:hypothetical protein